MNDYLVTKELYHHGIKGQKWGVRRYQNEDGTLTEAGRKRVTNHLGKIEPGYYTHRGFIKDKTKTYTFLRENNIITDSDVKKQRELEDKYIDAVKKINSKAFVNGMVLVSKQENQKLNKMVNDILFNLGSVSTKFLNTNERSIFKKQMAREYLRTLMYNDEKFYKKNN